MNRIDRLTAMILMLQSHRVVTAEQVAAHFEISVRTVYRDMSALGEAGVPIISEAGVGYSLMRGYHMPPIMFTEEEAAALFMSAELTEQSSDESLKQSLRGALLKVRAALPVEKKDYLSRLGNVVGVWERPKGLTEDRCLMPIQEAVVRRRCVSLQYDTGGRGELSERVVEALGVVFYARHWHLIAWCRMRQGFRDFRLDRMREWKVLEEAYVGHEDFSVEDFLEHEVDEKEFTAVSMTCERWALEKLLSDMPARFVQKTDMPDDRVQVDALAYSLDWLAHWLLGMGASVQVSSPEALRGKVVAAAKAVVAQYDES